MAGKVVEATMQANRLSESDLGVGSQFSRWFSSVHENPSLLYKTLTSICDLIQYAKDLQGNQKQQNCEFALPVYLSPHSTESCMTCQNGGIAVNIDQTCKCSCPPGFGGPSCAYFYQTNKTDSTDDQQKSVNYVRGERTK